MDETLTIYVNKIKGSSNFTHAQFFSEFQTWIRFSLEGRGHKESREEVFTYAAFFVSSSCVKIDTKTAAQETREEDVMHDD